MIRVIREWEQWRALAQDWNALAQACGRGQVFLSIEWLSECCRRQDRIWEPYIVAEFRDGLLTAAGAFALMGRVPGRRRLFFMGMGPSDYQGVMGDRDAQDNIWRAVFDQKDWDWIDLDPVDEDEWRRIKTIAGDRGCRADFISKGIVPVLDLKSVSDLSHRKAVKLARYEWRRLQRDEHCLSVRRCQSPEALPQYLEAFFWMHRQRWEAAGGTSRFIQPAVREQFCRLAEAWHTVGVLDAQGLFRDEAMIAVHIGAKTDQRFYYHSPAYDPAWHKHSPGKILLWQLINQCREAGIRYFDFLRGAESYKQQWSAKTESQFGRLRIYRNTLFGGWVPEATEWLRERASNGNTMRHVLRPVKQFLGE